MRALLSRPLLSASLRVLRRLSFRESLRRLSLRESLRRLRRLFCASLRFLSADLVSVLTGSGEANKPLIAATIFEKNPGSAGAAGLATAAGLAAVVAAGAALGVPKPLIAGCCASARSNLRGS